MSTKGIASAIGAPLAVFVLAWIFNGGDQMEALKYTVGLILGQWALPQPHKQ